MNKNSHVNSFYVILSGLFTFNSENLNITHILDHYTPWKKRINQGNYQSTFDYLKKCYYESFLNNIFPEIRIPSDQLHFNKEILNHFTLTKCICNDNPFKGLTLKVNENKSISFDIEYADIYLFPHEIGFVSFKCTLSNDVEQSLETISDFLYRVRDTDHFIQLPDNGKNVSVPDFIFQSFLNPLGVDPSWTTFNPQLKTYINIDLSEFIDEDERDHLMFDIGNMTPIGSSKGEGFFAPSKQYYEKIIHDNKVSVFQNWSALFLFDTFTRISVQSPDTFKSWEYEYFNLYIHTLYLKFFMYITNSEISDVTIVTKKTQIIRDKFIEFINDYYHSHVSNKFLPDLIQSKLMYALDIHSEIEKMETKIKRINEHSQEKREQKLNQVLIVLAIISIFSVIYDASNWLINLGFSEKQIFPFPSLVIATIFFLSIIFIFKMKK